MTKLKIGDKVRVVTEREYPDYGLEGVVVDLDDDGAVVCFAGWGDGWSREGSAPDCWWFCEGTNDLELVGAEVSDGWLVLDEDMDQDFFDTEDAAKNHMAAVGGGASLYKLIAKNHVELKYV